MSILPEQTISYKTYVKETFVQALSPVFTSHPDPLLQHTKVSIEYPRTEADYPSVVIRFHETDIANAGVGHSEQVIYGGQTLGNEISATLTGYGSITLNWPAVPDATQYSIYRGTASGAENEVFITSDNTFVDGYANGLPASPPISSTSTLNLPAVSAVAAPGSGLSPGTYFYVVTAWEPLDAAKYRHYYYHADIEFVVYALSALDRDLIADTLVQTVAMGTLTGYTAQFLDRIYPNALVFPQSQFHIININTDQLRPTPETEQATPWGAEDDLIYQMSYQTNLFGELYSLPPGATYGLIRRILLYPQIQGFPADSALPPTSITGWVSNG